MARVLRRLPAGAVFGCAFIALTHLAVSRMVYPHPIAREPMRRKVLALTQANRPQLLIAGDCRAAYQVRPDIVADETALPPGSVINVATPGQTPAAVLAAYREFAERFAPNPIVVISISVTLVNDTVAAVSRTNELLWSLNLLDRTRIVSTRYAVTAGFLPEQTFFKRLLVRLRGPDPAPPVADYGFDRRKERAPDESGGSGFESESLSKGIDHFRRHWVVGPVLQGVAWRQMQADLRTLVELGLQVVVLDTPLHPALTEAIAGTPAGETYDSFRVQLADMCDRTGMPILAYGADLFTGHDPDELFFELTQLNPVGAVVLSHRVGADLRALISAGVLRRPQEQQRPNIETMPSSDLVRPSDP